MGILKAIEIVSAAMVLAFLIIAAAAWVATAVCEALDRRRQQRQQEQSRPRDYAVWHTWPGTYQEPESKFEFPMGRDEL